MAWRWRVPIVDWPGMRVDGGRAYMKNNAGTGAPRIGTTCGRQQCHQTGTRQKRKKPMFHGVLRVIRIVVGQIVERQNECLVGAR